MANMMANYRQYPPKSLPMGAVFDALMKSTCEVYPTFTILIIVRASRLVCLLLFRSPSKIMFLDGYGAAAAPECLFPSNCSTFIAVA
jgi:hypothetical protein